MIKRLPRYAETELQRLCAKAGALCHAVDEDESGWDRLIEFPEKEFPGPADTRPPRAVAYVACDPAALARDVAIFAEHGYRLSSLRAFDLFPMTHHVECVALLEKAAR